MCDRKELLNGAGLHGPGAALEFARARPYEWSSALFLDFEIRALERTFDHRHWKALSEFFYNWRRSE